MANVFKYAAGQAKKAYKSKDEPLFNNTGKRSINNLFSGYELGGKGKLLVAGGIAAYGGVSVFDSAGIQKSYELKQLTEQQSEEQDVESLLSTRADGVGYTGNVGSMGNLEANGDLVFALNKIRHGG